MQFVDLLLPYYWGNEGWVAKMRFLEDKERKLKYDTYFIGSSVSHRQINPSLFDSLTQSTTSFNMGYPGTSSPELYWLCEQFIKECNSDVKNIFFDLMPIVPIAESNAHKRRVIYHMNFANTLLAISKFNAKGSRDLSQIKSFVISYFENVFKLGVISDIFKYFLNLGAYSKDFGNVRLGPEKNGYFSTDDQAKIGQSSREKFIVRNVQFLSDTLRLTKYQNYLSKLYIEKEFPGFNRNILLRLQNLDLLAKEKSIKFIVVLPPRFNPEAYDETFPLFKELDFVSRIDMANPNLFPEYYLSQNSFDIAHLNSKGARIFTANLAEAFLNK